MPEINTFACDACGVQKRDVNHWWMLWVETWQNKGPVLCAREFDAEFWAGIDQPLRVVACGEEHALQLAGRWMVSGSFEAPSQRALSKSAESVESVPRLTLGTVSESRTVDPPAPLPETEPSDV